jgi:hypothetical protein
MEIPAPDQNFNPPLETGHQFVGLYGTSNDRNCERHSCCGEDVPGKTVVTVVRNGKQTDKEEIKVVRI